MMTAPAQMTAPAHDDRKGHHYYIRVNRLEKPVYSSDDPCGHHGREHSSCSLRYAFTAKIARPPNGMQGLAIELMAPV